MKSNSLNSFKIQTFICEQVGDLEEVKIPLTMQVKGCPITFQLTACASDQKPIVR